MLVEKRKLSKRVDPGKNCIPSGGVEQGETPEEAVFREIKEEFDVDANNPSVIGSLIYPCSEVDFLINYFLVKEWKGEIKKLEADEIYWTEIMEENLDIWPDKLIVQAVKELFKIGLD